MRFNFVVTNQEDVNYDIPYNGNNGNYEECKVYLDDAYITDITICDWNVVNSRAVMDNLHPDKPFWFISNGLLFMGSNAVKNTIIRTKSHRTNQRKERGLKNEKYI